MGGLTDADTFTIIHIGEQKKIFEQNSKGR
jgi:hypothetical protein